MRLRRTLLAAVALAAFSAVNLLAAPGPNRDQRFDSKDTDGNGSISREEFIAVQPERVAERFAAIDTDGDGVATLEEFKAARGNRQGKGQLAGRQKARGKPQAFAAFDANGDGGLSLAEFTEHLEKRAAQRFDRLDANGDGSLTRSELRSGARRRGQEGDGQSQP